MAGVVTRFPQRQPLPPNQYDENTQANWYQAYEWCRQNEADAGSNTTRLMYARCLGYLIREAPTDAGRDMLSEEINERRGDQDAMDALAQLYINHLLLLFRQDKGRTPTPSPSEHPSPSRLSFDDYRVEASAPRDHSEAKRAALKRDGYRCMVTRFVDKSVWEHFTPQEITTRKLNGTGTNTQYCHIFPLSINWNLQPTLVEHHKTNHARSVGSIVHIFSGIDVLGELNGVNIHHLRNGLTLTLSLRKDFNDLNLWFQPIPNQPNTYTIHSLYPDDPFLNHLQSRTITFTTTRTSSDLELPDPRYLALHAAVCRVAHLSGVAEYLDMCDREVEGRNLKVLARDGSEGEVLAARLQSAGLDPLLLQSFLKILAFLSTVLLVGSAMGERSGMVVVSSQAQRVALFIYPMQSKYSIQRVNNAMQFSTATLSVTTMAGVVTRFPEKQPLPANEYDANKHPNWYQAYERCHLHEQAAGTNTTRLMYARCLGYLIREAPTDDGRDVISEEINGCRRGEEDMDFLAQLYVNYLLRLFKQDRVGTLDPPGEDYEEFFSSAVKTSPKDHLEAKRAALERDGCRCMVTHQVETAVVEDLTPQEITTRNLDGPETYTEYCHIFPPSINWNLQPTLPGHLKSQYVETLSGMVFGFSRINVLDELNGTNIHHLKNGLTMDMNLHKTFDNLKIWFEAVPVHPNTYTVCALSPNYGFLNKGQNRTITFTTTSPELELPDPRYLALHAAVCRVAHLSGAAEFLALQDREMEENSFLANDGSSSNTLATRLHQLTLAA